MGSNMIQLGLQTEGKGHESLRFNLWEGEVGHDPTGFALSSNECDVVQFAVSMGGKRSLLTC